MITAHDSSLRLSAHASRAAAASTFLMAAVALAFALLPVAEATAYRQVAPAQALLAADSVVLGTVLDVAVEVAGELVWTVVTVRVDREFGAQEPDAGEGGSNDPEQGQDEGLGAGAADELELRFLGGSPAGEPPLFVAGMPSFAVGDRFIAALHSAQGLASPIVGFSQGLWRLEGGGARDADGRYLGLVPSADGAAPQPPGTVGEEPVDPPAAAADVVIGWAAVPTDLDTLFDAIQRLLGGDVSLARPAAADAEADGGEPPTPADGEGAGDAGDLAELAEGAYSVSDFGGPLLLSDSVAAAAAAWVALAPEAIVLRSAPDASARFAYGDEELFGADTFALTLIRSGGSRSLLSPSSGAMLGAALRHELGLVLGLAETGPDGALPRQVASDTSPGPAQLAALAALARLVPGDLDGDGYVDLADLLEFAARFGRSGLNEPADLDRDGIVDEGDLAALRELYQFRPPSLESP